MKKRPTLDPAQQAAVDLEGRDLLITAGAGTGKTTVLVERVLRKLRTGVTTLDRLLLVTFTDKAAREMKERLFERLSEDPALRPQLTQLPRASISTIHGFCARLLREHFVEAGIEPAFRILDDRGQKEARGDALRRVFHEAYRDDARARRFRSLVEMAGYDRDGELLRHVAVSLYETALASEDPLGFLSRTKPASSLAEVTWFPRYVDLLAEGWKSATDLYRAAIELAEAELDPAKFTKHRAFIAKLERVTLDDFATPEAQAALFDRLRAEGVLDAGARFEVDLPRTVTHSKRAPYYTECFDAAKKIWASSRFRRLPLSAEAILAEDEAQRDSIGLLEGLALRLHEEYGAWKARFGLLDYSDLELMALKLLREHGEALGVRDRFDEVLIDEYQDVNRLQESILELVSRPGRRFRVGDVKQSIYQFRQADPTLFMRHVESSLRFDPERGAPPGDDPVAIFLKRNHRSRPAILSAVNTLFGSLFDRRTIGTEYAAQSLESTRVGDDALPWPEGRPVELHLLEGPPKPSRSQSADATEGGDTAETAGSPDGSDVAASNDSAPESGPAIEARFIASRLRAWLAEENARRPEGGLSFRHVAILLRTSSAAIEYVQAFEREQIPVSLAEAGSLLEERSVQDLRALLRIVDNPRNDVALAAVLRSPVLAIEDSELLRMRLAWPNAKSFLDVIAAVAYAEDAAAEGGFFWPPMPGGDPRAWTGEPSAMAKRIAKPVRDRMRRFLDQLRGFRGDVERLSLPRLLVRLIEATDFRARRLASGDAPAEWIYVERLLALAREYEEERGPSLRGFLARLDALEASDGLKGPRGDSSREDAVAILSVHKSKGLQFPIVILPRVAWSFQDDNRLGSQIRIGRRESGIRSLDWKSFSRRDTVLRALLAEESRIDGVHEEARVLYVAMTRAEERLILVAQPRKSPDRLGEAPPALIEHDRARAGTALPWLVRALPWHAASSSEPDAPHASAKGWNVYRHPYTPPPSAPPSVEPPAPKLRSALEIALARLGRPEPLVAAFARAEIRGKYWVTEFKRQSDFEQRTAIESDASMSLWLPEPAPQEGGARLGTRFHSALQRIDLDHASPEELDRQFVALASEPWWEGDERALALERGFTSFLEGPIGRRMIAAHGRGTLEREAAFSLKWPVARLCAYREDLAEWVARERDRLGPVFDAAWVLLQGRIDCVFREDDRVVVVDWKTDRVNAETLPARVEAYRVQMELYREAAAALWGASVECWLVFLSRGESIEVGAPE